MKTYPKFYVSHPSVNGGIHSLHRLTPYIDEFAAKLFMSSHRTSYPEGLILRRLDRNQSRRTIKTS